MRLAIALLALLLPAASLAAEAASHDKPFPLPEIDGKKIAVASGQTSFSLPMKFSRAEAFFREQFKQEPRITLKAAGAEGTRSLTIESKRLSDAWAKAVVKEREVTTTVDVTFIFVAPTGDVAGKMPPVLFIPRSAEAAKDADSIEHLEHPKK
jgi:hypothetical protein